MDTKHEYVLARGVLGFTCGCIVITCFNVVYYLVEFKQLLQNILAAVTR